MEQQSIEYLLPFLLYAETHFRFFPWMPSLLYKKCPEILFDCPHRLDPENDLPVTLIINDTAGKKVNIEEVQIAVNQTGKAPVLFTFTDKNLIESAHDFKHNQRVFILKIKREKLFNGQNFINCKACVSVDKKHFQIINDNYFSSLKLPLRCFVSRESLPGRNSCSYGDMHFHTQYSQSHVEFGPPLDALDETAKSSGLAFVAITDHSYDLACCMDNYLREDLKNERWASLQKQLCQNRWETTFLPGEEISCLNSSGNTVHLCGIGLSDYIPGSMDGARRKILYKSKLAISEVISRIVTQGGFAYAAHPGSKKTLMQYLFLNRGAWTDRDIAQKDLGGVQAFNGSYKAAWTRGYDLWVNALKKGQKLALIAGNDAHGDFNRYRAIKVPFFSILENEKRYLGFGKTGVYSTETSQENLINAIRLGRTFITTGPFISICHTINPDDCAISFENIPQTTKTLFLHCMSTEEFGFLTLVKVFMHFYGSNSEICIFSKTYIDETTIITEKIDLETEGKSGFLRAMAVSELKDGSTAMAFSGACYF